jgi:hypothetical protein
MARALLTETMLQVKKTFLSTSNVIVSQCVRSTFLKLFAHVLLVV